MLISPPMQLILYGESMAIYSVAYHSPRQLEEQLLEDGFSRRQIKYVGDTDSILEQKIPRITVFLTFNAFKRNMREVFTHKRKTFFVMCSPILSYKYHLVVEPCDWYLVTDKRTATLAQTKLSYEFKATPEYELTETFLDVLTNQVKKGSILNSLMTSIYTISNNQSQKAATLTICKWFIGEVDCSTNRLMEMLKNEYNLPQANIDRLVEVLNNPLVRVFKKVFGKLNSDRSNVKKLCNKYGIPPFEVNYILAKCANDKDSNKRNIDELMNG